MKERQIMVSARFKRELFAILFLTSLLLDSVMLAV